MAGRMLLPASKRTEGAGLETQVEELAESFQHAARSGATERTIRIGGAAVRMRFAGACLAEQLSRAYDHLAYEGDDDPDLTIDVWDAVDSGSPPPPLPALDPKSPRGTTLYTADGGRYFACRPALGQLSAYDQSSARGWFWCHDARELPFWEPAAPFRQILHWWLPNRNALLLHGAAVGRADGGVLFVGAGGSGKSTCALACLASELLYAGDDYVGVELGTEPRVLSLFCSGKTEPAHARLLPHLPSPMFAGDGAREEKSVFYVGQAFPERMCEAFPLRAIVAPRVRGPEPRVRPLAPAQALAALAPSTLLQLVPARQQALSTMARLLDDIPAFGLDVGGPPELIPPTIDHLLGELS